MKKIELFGILVAGLVLVFAGGCRSQGNKQSFVSEGAALPGDLKISEKDGVPELTVEAFRR